MKKIRNPTKGDTAMPHVNRRRPYTLVGSGRLTATIWKSGSEQNSGNYQFNIVRTNRRTGRVLQRFASSDLHALTKLVQVLAFTLADDGCVSAEERRTLFRLATRLDRLLESGD